MVSDISEFNLVLAFSRIFLISIVFIYMTRVIISRIDTSINLSKPSSFHDNNINKTSTFVLNIFIFCVFLILLNVSRVMIFWLKDKSWPNELRSFKYHTT